MTKPQPKHAAILMGDIVASSAHPDPKALQKEFAAGVALMNKEFAAQIRSPLTITLGDEFQGVVETLATAFDIAHRMRILFLMQGIECRFVVGAGEISTKVNAKKAWNMMGPGLAAVRERLNSMDDENAYDFVLAGDPILSEFIEIFAKTMTEIERNWTKTQLAYMGAYYLKENRSAVNLAKAFKVTGRNVYKVIDAAKLKLYEEQLKGVTIILRQNDKSNGADK
ncbi:SatD family protein [Hyphococcus sp.]|uniref:SatD family protein n=1 Tax=Hyphococcus sp. TaxID=2038636 RepID=UPI002082E894|nr:MAG: hypothetical protein DHS20C04_28420 [Marinicaulis sp.]